MGSFLLSRKSNAAGKDWSDSIPADFHYSKVIVILTVNFAALGFN
jgi:hypothetical protein